jgi:hypothetical protein
MNSLVKCTLLPAAVLGLVSGSLADEGYSPVLDRQLFLPKSYRTYFPDLQNAAVLASQMEGCTRFLRGELQLDLSTPDHPIFSMLCRGENNRSFAFLVDGKSLHLLDETRPEGSISFADLELEVLAKREQQKILDEKIAAEALAEAARQEEIAALKEAEEARVLEEERRKRLWDYCLRQLTRRVQNMHGLNWLTKTMPEPQILDGNRLNYYIEFDALDLYQQPLQYQAECDIYGEGDHKLTVRPRQDSLVNESN